MHEAERWGSVIFDDVFVRVRCLQVVLLAVATVLRRIGRIEVEKGTMNYMKGPKYSKQWDEEHHAVKAVKATLAEDCNLR